MAQEKGWLRSSLDGFRARRVDPRVGEALSGREVYIVIYALGFGGRTTAILDQCDVFSELGMDPVIVTFDFRRDFESSVREALHGRVLSPRTSIINMYEDLKWRGAPPVTEGPVVPDGTELERLASATHTAGGRSHRTYFDDRGRCLLVRQERDGVLERDIEYSDGVPRVIREYDSSGFCSRESSLFGGEDAVSEERYYAPDGTCYLTRTLDPASKKQRGHFWHFRGEQKSRRFAHNTPLHTAWLEDVLRSRSEGRRTPFVIGESASGVLKVLDVDPHLANRMYMFHENHLAAPHTLGAPIRGDYGNAPKRIHEMPLLVVPTNKQADDIRAQFGEDVHVRGIGNLVADKRSGAPIEKIEGRIGSFGRLAPTKQIDRTLRVFRTVSEQVSHARLDIFGDGPERGKLEALAKDLGIRDLVTFHGRVANVGDEMARCAVVVSTTSTESFGLSIGESLAVGTPVVSYSVNYGPSDLIRDGIDGYLVNPNDDEALAEQIIGLLRDPDKARSLGAQAEKHMSENFSRAAFSAAWQAAFLEVDSDERQGRGRSA